MVRGSDFVILKDDSVKGVSRRIKEYGLGSALKQSKGVIVGIVCSFDGEDMVVAFGDEVSINRWHEVSDCVTKVYRNRTYDNQYLSLGLEERAMALYARDSQYERIRNSCDGTPGAIFSYILTAPDVVYPTGYAKLDFNISELFSQKNGFREVDHG